MFSRLLLILSFLTLFLLSSFQKISAQSPVPSSYCPSQINCSLKSEGDANCDNKIDEADYTVWKDQFDTIPPSKPNNNNANFHCRENDTSTYKVDLMDFEILRRTSYTQTNLEEISSYSSPEQGYGFRYLKSWKIDKQGTLTVSASPDNPNLQQCAATLEKILACDVLVSTMPYGGTVSTAPDVTVYGLPPAKTHEEQIKEIATQFAIGNSITPITLNNLKGYDAPSTNTDGSSYNVLLQGSKNMILVQFPYKKSRSDLNLGQTTILESITEM